MKFKAKPVNDLTDVTLDLEQLEQQGIFNDTALSGDLTGKLPKPTVAKINGTTVPLTGSAWVAPTLINVWVNAGGGLETVGYLKDPLGFVHIKGSVSGGGNGTVAFVLPAGFRPGATTFSPAVAQGPNFASTQISIAGNVTIFYVTGPIVGLSGITFLAEN